MSLDSIENILAKLNNELSKRVLFVSNDEIRKTNSLDIRGLISTLFALKVLHDTYGLECHPADFILEYNPNDKQIYSFLFNSNQFGKLNDILLPSFESGKIKLKFIDETFAMVNNELYFPLTNKDIRHSILEIFRIFLHTDPTNENIVTSFLPQDAISAIKLMKDKYIYEYIVIDQQPTLDNIVIKIYDLLGSINKIERGFFISQNDEKVLQTINTQSIIIKGIIGTNEQYETDKKIDIDYCLIEKSAKIYETNSITNIINDIIMKLPYNLEDYTKLSNSFYWYIITNLT